MEEKNKGFDLQRIKEFIVLMETHDLVEIEIVCGNDKVFLKRASKQVSSIPNSMIEQHPASDGSSDKDLVVIKSEMVGTFYAAVSPEDSEPFVSIGSGVTPQTTVCIIDSMKVLSEIKAEITGIVVEILAKNGQAIEYGTPLFKVRPDK